jgi:hypothetical protein
MMSSLYVFILVMGLLIGMNETHCGYYRTWIKVMAGIYLFDLLVSMQQLMHLKKTRSENLWMLLSYLITLVVATGWYIYGNVIYWKNREECADPELGDAPALTQTMWIMMLIGYATLLKCCCLGSCLIYLTPMLI